MVALNGSLVLLKINENDHIITIGGMRTTKFSLNNQLIDATNKDSGSWRELLPNSGISHITIGGNGIFTNSESESILCDAAFNNKVSNFEISFANGDILKGKFHISNYDRIGNFNEEENYSIVLESTGKVVYQSIKKDLI